MLKEAAPAPVRAPLAGVALGPQPDISPPIRDPRGLPPRWLAWAGAGPLFNSKPGRVDEHP